MRCKFDPGKGLLAEARAGFIRRQSSLAAWCRNNNVTTSWANQALTGKRGGPSAARLRRRIAAAAGIESQGGGK
jgi:hypothetical protein